MVNLRRVDPETEYVAFDRPRVLRVLARVIADLDGLVGFPPIAEEEAKKGSAETRRTRHRQRLADRPATETTDRAGRTGRSPCLARSSALREGLNQPGPGPTRQPAAPSDSWILGYALH